MTKNYFTDGQIRELVLNKLKADGVDITEAINAPSERELKNLKEFANLAVEAAIGEPVAWRNKELPSEICTSLDEFHSDFDDVMLAESLYLVKELEN